MAQELKRPCMAHEPRSGCASFALFRFFSPVQSVPLLAPCESLWLRRRRSLGRMRSLALDTLIWGSFTLILKPPLEIHLLVGQHVLCSSAQRGQRAICIHAAGYCVWVASKRRQQILKILRSGWSTNLGFDKLFESLLRCSCLPDSNSRIFGQQACTTLI